MELNQIVLATHYPDAAASPTFTWNRMSVVDDPEIARYVVELDRLLVHPDAVADIDRRLPLAFRALREFRLERPQLSGPPGPGVVPMHS